MAHFNSYFDVNLTWVSISICLGSDWSALLPISSETWIILWMPLLSDVVQSNTSDKWHSLHRRQMAVCRCITTLSHYAMRQHWENRYRHIIIVCFVVRRNLIGDAATTHKHTRHWRVTVLYDPQSQIAAIMLQSRRMHEIDKAHHPSSWHHARCKVILAKPIFGGHCQTPSAACTQLILHYVLIFNTVGTKYSWPVLWCYKSSWHHSMTFCVFIPPII